MFKLSKHEFYNNIKKTFRSYKKHARIEKTQKGIQLAQILEDETTVTLTNFKYEKKRIRKLLAKMIIVNEKPFRFVVSRLFNIFYRALQ